MSARQYILPILCGLLLAFAPCSDSQGANEESAANHRSTGPRVDGQSIEGWIELLGSDQYALRQRAESVLLSLGADAFDQLKSVENHPDLEVASRVHYILSQIQVAWVRPGDPANLRKWMVHYGELSESDRLGCIDRLVAMQDPRVLTVLSRIARFDPSPLLSRVAALEVLELGSLETGLSLGSGSQAIARELGESNRSAVRWIRTYLSQRGRSQGNDPKTAVARWTRLVDAEIQLLGTQSSATDEEIILKLLQHQLDLCQRLQQPAALEAVLERVVDLYVRSGQPAANGLAYALDWVLQSGQWQSLDPLEARYGDVLKAHRELLYLTAAVRAEQGRNERATELASRAFHLEANDKDDRNILASQLVRMGHFDWAEREWRYVTRSFPVLSDEAMTARTDLSMWLHDRLRHLDAARLLQEIEDEIRADPKQEQKALRDPQQRFMLTVTSSRKEYYFACHAESQHDYAAQKAHLAKAIDRYEIDADVLIAMYRMKDADEAYRLDTLKRIKRVGTVLSQQIHEYPRNANLLNHWAWLIANTEGDYQQALTYSRASLKQQPEEASFLDTLARCLYVTGDVEGALEQQRKAAQWDPHVHALKRQLAFLEQEVARRKEKTIGSKNGR